MGSFQTSVNAVVCTPYAAGNMIYCILIHIKVVSLVVKGAKVNKCVLSRGEPGDEAISDCNIMFIVLGLVWGGTLLGRRGCD